MIVPAAKYISSVNLYSKARALDRLAQDEDCEA